MLMSKVVKKLTLAIGYHRLAKKKKNNTDRPPILLKLAMRYSKKLGLKSFK